MDKQFLIIDTSGPDSFVALWKKGELLIEHLPPLKQSQTLLPALEKLLENEEIDFIAVGTGPGSFTGTRVGVMTAKTLAFAKGIPLLPFCSLMIYTPEEDGPFTIATDARSQQLYLLSGKRSGEEIAFEEPIMTQGNLEVSCDLNLPFLTSYLLKKFLDTLPSSSHKAEVCYLKT
ncbi:MAG: tRNA (adenosine(37)-N6)-threonylcarbamoyltransferase complex dimerization subunit type 1 TsaB [Chlamydiales bacterium]|nr:tRNA (adenosine(37)-N6)-threonylcarbamoyltransferase complex dimerization subunit type 1 TsaB [Chlamydiales bacterium]